MGPDIKFQNQSGTIYFETEMKSNLISWWLVIREFTILVWTEINVFSLQIPNKSLNRFKANKYKYADCKYTNMMET